jgi:hypothetical protein
MWEIAQTAAEVMSLLNKKDGWHRDSRSIARI